MRGGVHFADVSTGFAAMCGDAGSASSTKYDCCECVHLLRRRRKERKLVECAQVEANKLVRKKKMRIARAKERSRVMTARM